MKTILKFTAVAGAIMLAGNAHAWPVCKDGTISVLTEQSRGSYVCPCGGNSFVTPTQSCPAPTTPPPATLPPTNLTANPTADADAKAQAAADAIARAMAQGGEASAKAVNDMLASLSADQRTAVMNKLSNKLTSEQMAQLTNNSPSSALATNGPIANRAGGAQVTSTTTSIVNGSVVLPPTMQQAPAVPVTMAQGTTTVTPLSCAPALQYTAPSAVADVRKYSMSPDVVYMVPQGLMGIERPKAAEVNGQKVEPQAAGWRVLTQVSNADEFGTEYRIVEGEIAREVITPMSMAVTNGFSLNVAGEKGGIGGGYSSGGANAFTQIQYALPKPCQMVQTKVENAWVDTEITPLVLQTMVRQEKIAKLQRAAVVAKATEPDPFQQDIRDALQAIKDAVLALKADTTTPVAMVKETKGTCELMEFTNKKGQTFMACPGSRSGNFTRKEVVQGTVTTRIMGRTDISGKHSVEAGASIAPK